LGENINAVKKDTEAILSATYFATKFEIKLWSVKLELLPVKVFLYSNFLTKIYSDTGSVRDEHPTPPK
jgi:hypothetical protein